MPKIIKPGEGKVSLTVRIDPKVNEVIRKRLKKGEISSFVNKLIAEKFNIKLKKG